MRSLGIALAFLTRLPTWDPGVLPPEALGPPTRWFPLVGALAVGIAVAWIGPWALGSLGVAAVGFAVPATWARRHLGAASGDVLGAGQQLTELGVLLLGAALVTTGSHPEVPFWR